MKTIHSKLQLITAIVALGLFLPLTASATVINFNSLSGILVSKTYSEAGYTFTLNPSGGTDHFGDGSGGAGTLNWHDGGANAPGVNVTLTKDDANLFDLFDFDIVGLSGTFLVNGTPFNTTGNKVVNFLSVASVVFDVANSGGIDNINLAQSSVPEPATLVLLGLGLAGLGFGARKKKLN